MSSLALINEFLGQRANAAEHGYQIDHIIEFCHWFMGALFLGWSAFFVFVLIRFHRSRHPRADHHGVKSGISTHLEFSVVLIEAVLLIGFAIPLWAKRVNQFPDTKDAILVHAVGQQFIWNFHLPGPDGQFGRRDINLVSNTNPVGLDPNDPYSKDDIVVSQELHVPVDRPVIIELSSKDSQFLPAEYAHRARCNSGLEHSDVVPALQDWKLRSRLRSALRPGSLRHERNIGGRLAGRLPGLAERTR
jgi:cytochrome c oxidase subunit 2